MKSTYSAMFGGDIKEELQKAKETQEQEKNNPINTNRQEDDELSSNVERIEGSNTKKEESSEEQFEPRQRTRKPGETRGRKAVKHSGSSIMFEINEELVDFFDQASYLNRMNKKEYMNYLIRKDMIERIGSSKTLMKSTPKNNEKLMEDWEEYKKKWIAFLNQQNQKEGDNIAKSQEEVDEIIKQLKKKNHPNEQEQIIIDGITEGLKPFTKQLEVQ